jgi:tetratricopeptide (TPR) repeat protein
MFVYGLVYWILSIFLVLYLLRKYILLHRNVYLCVLIMQVISNIVQIASIAIGITPEWYMQLYFVVFSFVVPLVIVAADFINSDIEELYNIKIGDHYAKKSDYLNAISRYKNAISRNSKNSETYAKIGRMYKANGDRRTAFDRFAKAIDLNKEDYKSYYEIGLIFIEMGKNADAQIVLDNALRIRPDYTPASEVLAKVFVSESKYEDACNIYKNALKYDEDNYELYYNMGMAKLELNNIDDAEMCYKRAIELNPTLYKAYFGLGQISLLKNDLIRAESMFKKSLPDNDIMAKAYYQIAKIRMLKNDDDSAITFLGYAFDIDSTYRTYAEEEPIFAKIKDYINEIGLDTDTSKRLAKYEAMSSFQNEKYEVDIPKEETTVHDIPETTMEYSIEDNMVKDEPLEQENLDNTTTQTYSTESEPKKYEVTEEFDESAYFDEEPEKTSKVLGFFKKIFGIGKDNDIFSDDEDEFEEQPDDEEVTTTSSKEEIIDEKVDNFNTDEKKAFETSFTEEDLNIFEKFKKLKEVEDKKFEELKASERYKQIDYKKQDDKYSREKIEENRKNRVRYLSEDEADNYKSSPVREAKVRTIPRASTKKRSFDFDTAEINPDLAIGIEDLDGRSFSKQIEHIENEDEPYVNLNSKTEDIPEVADTTVETSTSDTGFDFLKRYKR